LRSAKGFNNRFYAFLKDNNNTKSTA
jgi:hypothetical protein